MNINPGLHLVDALTMAENAPRTIQNTAGKRAFDAG
jgi:hypothetical protein